MTRSGTKITRPGTLTYLMVGFSALLFLTSTILTIQLSVPFLVGVSKHSPKISSGDAPTVKNVVHAKSTSTWKGNTKNVKPAVLVRSLVRITQSLHQASMHAKSLKTISALRKATGEIKTLLRQLGLSYGNVTARDVTAPRMVCPEEYRGTKYGSDSYEKGFETVPCEHSRPLSELITVLVLLDSSTTSVHSVVTDIQGVIPGVKTVVGLKEPRTHGSGAKPDNALVTQVTYTMEEPEGQVWNYMLESVQTEYVLVARDVHIFDKNMRIGRLIRVMEMLGFVAAGGATRDSLDGKWKLGCYQNGMRNYTAVYQEGYDESIQECVICDYTDGPFVISTKTLREESFDSKITGVGHFHDLFLRLGQEKLVVCSDSMFHVRPTIMQATSTSWESFARKWEIYKLKFVPGLEIIFKCDFKTRQACAFKTSRLQHPCCVADIVSMLSHVVSLCESRGIVYEARSGTLLGAVKLKSILPWDIDADLNYLLSNYSIVKQLVSHFSFPGHRCHVQIAPQYDYNNTLLSASFQLDSNTSFWKVEIWGKPSSSLTSCTYRTAVNSENGRTVRTRVNINNIWVQTAYNPGLWARNRYGSEVFRHAQHWRSLGKLTSLEPYPTHAFLECPEPGHHACLDFFNTDGNLQFSDPIP
ncbi:uncharacterized protein LOC110458399 [Mizuhopecten yessoensis]|uniref:uncharacterized protein LOC110458399 n=1 Tax=Mizuhopecten yessoensis TaxID=6573 RepID=UPI000B4575AE|nr:uncharacterized protein LOC110458399 [Mizuhopecten yessoensis]